MQQLVHRWWFGLFFLSGFSGLLYQIVWLRLAFAAFGVVTPVMSVLLSVFMLGLGLGSWLAGWLMGRWQATRQGALRSYAFAEAMIGVGGVAVPALFSWGTRLLLPAGESDSLTYLTCSAGIMLLALLPFCICMGLTFPLMMQAIRAGGNSSESFSFLYLANVLGAMFGTFLTPVVLVELLGFQHTLWVGASANLCAAGVSLWLSGGERRLEGRRSQPRKTVAASSALASASASVSAGVSPVSLPSVGTASREPASGETATSGVSPSEVPTAAPLSAGFAGTQSAMSPRFDLAILFTTGLTAMAVEVVWTRAFTPVLKTQVYSFAGLLFVYLLATWCGSWWYRRQLARRKVLSTPSLLAALSLAAFGQLLWADPRIQWPWEWVQIGWVLLSIMPYCGILGYLTPRLIDEYSAGHPQSAGRAYAVNVLGCILGPVMASYLLLPVLGVQWSGVLLALPLWGLAGYGLRATSRRTALSQAASKAAVSSQPTSFPPAAAAQASALPVAARRPALLWGAAAVCGVLAATVGTSYEDRYAREGATIRRDHTATVIAFITEGRPDLLVNGKSITSITPTTKLMAHLPLAQLREPPRSALVICFGMGTTYRSLLSWDIDTTAVELVPSVRDSFGFFFPDAAAIREHPRGKIVIDDGRRFLRRTHQRFDLITLDPPPPVEAAASSLLYSTEFYDLVKPRLTEQGILHQWYPGGELKILQALLRSVQASFPHVRMMRAFDGWGIHILASQQPIPRRSVQELVERMPASARNDLLEWNYQPADLFELVLKSELDVGAVLQAAPAAMITDDSPFNEYFVLRRLWQWWTGTYSIVL